MPNPDDSPVLLTVAICVFNRYEYVGSLLDALRAQDLERGRFEVWLIDNSNDEAALRQFENYRAHPVVARGMRSEPPGLSRARNLALSECDTELIAYIDDDAIPSPGWARAVVEAFSRPERPAIVAGPIIPVWSGSRPHWLPAKHEGCFSVLHLGGEDRELARHEYGYGANVSFRTEALRAADGFSNALGRIGSRTLLSGEETIVQDRIRHAGGRAFYASTAEVHHHVHAERAHRNWMRARLAWQAASEALQEPPGYDLEWSKRELRRLARILGRDLTIGQLLAYSDPQTFGHQLDLIRHLTTLLLACKDEPDEEIESLLDAEPVAVAHDVADDAGEDAAPVDDPYEYSVVSAVAPTARRVFFEALPGHSYLFDVWGDMPDSSLVALPFNPWYACTDELVYLERSLTSAVEDLVVMTLDPFVYGPATDGFLEFVERIDVPVTGILHRLPSDAASIEGLTRVAEKLDGLLVLSDSMRRQLATTLRLGSVRYLPHHPTKCASYKCDTEAVRRKLGIEPDQIVLSLLGEMRAGKGGELFLDALEELPSDVRRRIFVLLAGKATSISRAEAQARLLNVGVTGHVDLRDSTDPREFSVITDRQYAEAVEISDVGVLLYHGEQRYCMSGTLPDYVWANKHIFATGQSMVGDEVVAHGLGTVVDPPAPVAVAKALTRIVHGDCRSAWMRDSYRAFRASIAPSAVVEALSALLPGRVPAKPLGSERPRIAAGSRSEEPR